MNLSELSDSDPKIRTPLDRRPSDVRHDVVQGRGLIIRINRMLDHWHPKGIGHYRRGNGVPYTLYPTHHKSVGIIGVDREDLAHLKEPFSQPKYFS